LVQKTIRHRSEKEEIDTDARGGLVLLMATVGQDRQRVGRPRSKQSQEAILAATLAVLAEGGYTALSIEQVATRAGVGKTTIYRWWASKEELVIDAVKTLQAEAPIIDTGSFDTDVLAITQQGLRLWNTHRRLFLRLIGEASEQTELFDVFYARLVEPREQMFAAMVSRAQERGELRQDIDARIMFRIITGALWSYFLFSGSTPVSSQEVERIMEALLQGFGRR
jgi:AcrR family transcriptional regulator